MAKAGALERRNYRKVYVRIWNNPVFLGMPDALKVMTMYLLTGPQTNRIGLFRLSFGAAAETLQINLPQAQKRTREVCKAFGWQFDAFAQVLWIPSWWTFNPVADNPKNIRGYLTDLNDVPRTPLGRQFCENLSEIPDALHQFFQPWITVLSPPDQCSIGDTNTDRSTETTTETETCTETETMRRENNAPAVIPPKLPVREALTYFAQRFTERYGVSPVFSGKKDAGRAAGLLRSANLAVFQQRVDDYLTSSDKFFIQAGHTLDLFFSASTQTKLAVRAGRSHLSDTARHNLAGDAEYQSILEANEAQRTGTHGHRR